MTKSKTFDVVIIGAGLAGATLACALAPSNLKIALLDKALPPIEPVGDFDLRVSSLNRGSENILKQINAWPHINPTRAYVYDKVQVCPANGRALLTFDCAEIGEPHMGHMIENVNILHALIKLAKTIGNISLFNGICITDLILNEDNAEILTDQGCVAGKLVVGADGAKSLVRRLVGFDEAQGFYAQQCIVGTVQFDGNHNHTAWQRFLPTGPLGILPLAPGYCSLAWSCNNEFANKRLEESQEVFIESLQQALNGHLGNIISMPKRAAYPLSHMHPARYITHRLALIGDAAHAIHPLAGLGANLGIADAAALAQVLLQATNQNKFDPGQYETLRRYERWRKPQNQIFLNTMSGFNLLFGEKLDALNGLRSIGLQIADKFSPAKHRLMRKAMGL